MNYIFIDIEYSQHKNPNNTHTNHIIEVGAVKLNEQLEIIDTFQSYISPGYNVKINYRILKIMKIKNPYQTIYKAPLFRSVMNQLEKWINISDNNLIFAWSPAERIILSENYKRYKLVYTNHWINSIIDLQKKYSIIYRRIFKKSQVSLKDAVKYYKLNDDNDYHNALNDAMYTAQVFQIMFKRLGVKNLVFMTKVN